MNKTIRITDYFEYPGTEVSIKEFDTDKYVIDDRLSIAVEKRLVTADNLLSMYLAYVKYFCAELNASRNSRIKYLAECGFLPIGIEPNIFTGYINTPILIPKLREYDIPYFQMAPSSPVSMLFQSTVSSTSTRDIWVNKVDVAKLVNKPTHNITAIDVLEELIK